MDTSHTHSCDPLNKITVKSERILLTIFSKLTFIPEKNIDHKISYSMSVASLRFAIDYSQLITGFLLATYLDKYFLPFHITAKFQIFLTWSRSLATALCQIFHRTVRKFRFPYKHQVPNPSQHIACGGLHAINRVLKTRFRQ